MSLSSLVWVSQGVELTLSDLLSLESPNLTACSPVNAATGSCQPGRISRPGWNPGAPAKKKLLAKRNKLLQEGNGSLFPPVVEYSTRTAGVLAPNGTQEATDVAKIALSKAPLFVLDGKFIPVIFFCNEDKMSDSKFDVQTGNPAIPV